MVLFKFQKGENILPAKPEEVRSHTPTYSEKEQILVERITTQDMLQFTKIPYDLNCPVHKFIEKNSHPFAYINLNAKNQKIAKGHLLELDRMIDEVRPQIASLRSDYFIDVQKAEFCDYSRYYGYSRLICTPYTFKGAISKIPLSLIFMSRLDIKKYWFSGEINYDQGGKPLRGRVSIAKENGTFWLFTFNTINGEFLLEKAQTLLNPDAYGVQGTVYKHPYLILLDQEAEKQAQTFQWLQENLPALCPKSLSGFRRMRTTNSKNYQKLVAEAAKMGKQL